MSSTPPDKDHPASYSRKRATLARLLRVARKEFSEKGLAGARVDDIARAAGVTKPLVYHYFSSKEELFACVLDESAQDTRADLLALDLDHLPPVTALRTLLEHSFDLYRLDPPLGALTLESFRQHEHNSEHRKRFTNFAPVLVELMDKILCRGAVSGDFIPNVDARMFCAAAGLITTGGFINRYLTSSVTGFDTTSEQGMGIWRQYSVDFVLATVLTHSRPCLAASAHMTAPRP